MKPLARDDVVSRRVVEVIVSRPDKPVTMDGQSYSSGFVRLDNGLLLDLASDPPASFDETFFTKIARDRVHEKTFQMIIGKTIVDVLSIQWGGWGLAFESGHMITYCYGHFWVVPMLSIIKDYPYSTTRLVWQD